MRRSTAASKMSLSLDECFVFTRGRRLRSLASFPVGWRTDRRRPPYRPPVANDESPPRGFSPFTPPFAGHPTETFTTETRTSVSYDKYFLRSRRSLPKLLFSRPSHCVGNDCYARKFDRNYLWRRRGGMGDKEWERN